MVLLRAVCRSSIGGRSEIAGQLAASTASTLANAATRSALDGSSFGDNITAAIPDIVGQALGGAIADAVSPYIEEAVQKAKERPTEDTLGQQPANTSANSAPGFTLVGGLPQPAPNDIAAQLEAQNARSDRLSTGELAARHASVTASGSQTTDDLNPLRLDKVVIDGTGPGRRPDFFLSQATVDRQYQAGLARGNAHLAQQRANLFSIGGNRYDNLSNTDIANIAYEHGAQQATDLALFATTPAAFTTGVAAAAYAIADTTALGIDIFQNGLDGRNALQVATLGASALTPLPSGRTVLFSSDELGGVEPASRALLETVENKRAVTWATPGSDAERFLNMRGAEAAAFGADDILLRPNPSKAAVLEEFLHGTQQKLGIVDRLGTRGMGSAETHVKDFMIRHQRMLGLGAEDVERLQTLKDKGL